MLTLIPDPVGDLGPLADTNCLAARSGWPQRSTFYAFRRIRFPALKEPYPSGIAPANFDPDS